MRLVLAVLVAAWLVGPMPAMPRCEPKTQRAPCAQNFTRQAASLPGNHIEIKTGVETAKMLQKKNVSVTSVSSTLLRLSLTQENWLLFAISCLILTFELECGWTPSQPDILAKSLFQNHQIILAHCLFPYHQATTKLLVPTWHCIHLVPTVFQPRQGPTVEG